MIRDWGLWELTDEDWNEFVPVRDRQKKLEYSAKTPQGKESLAPMTEGKTSDRLSFASEEEELESGKVTSKKPAVTADEFMTVEVEKSPKPEDIPVSPPIQQELAQKKLIEKELVQKEENLEPIRVTSPKVSQTPKVNQREVPEIPVSTPAQIPQDTGFETVEMKEEISSPDPVPVSLKQQQETTVTSSQTNSSDRSLSQTILTVEDWNITVEEIVPLLEKYQLLPKLVREIIIDRALTSIACSPEELTQAMEGFYQQQQLNSPQKLQAWLQQKQTTTEQVQNAIARSLKLEKFKEQTWGDRLESYFLESKPQLDKVIYSLLRTQDVGVAQELYFRILEGEAEFSDLAKEYSQGIEAKNGGRIGPISLSKIHNTLKEIFQRSQPGQLWSPQYIDNWFVIVRLEQFVPAKLDEENRRQLLDERFNQWLQEQYQHVKYE
ncbi:MULTISPECIES: peptidylprolyl isomerase [Spirulina sp. CCY15215]|uniref:peptidylprolyl isomerase n=1 Tax=Spirulina sp. CCY15215 TaxID=2767591 RepID=UPI00194E93BC|nr:peptidylprolyl isomerase [Spirulina major]